MAVPRSGFGSFPWVSVALKLANDPPVILADEPTGNLDSQTGAAIFRLFGELASRGKTVVVVTHALESAFKIADRILILADGGVRALGTLAEIRRHPDARVQALLERRAATHEHDAAGYLDRLTAGADD